jgi:hypothetical protein
VVVSGHEDDLRCAGCAPRSIVAFAHRFGWGAWCMVLQRASKLGTQGLSTGPAWPPSLPFQ